MENFNKYHNNYSNIYYEEVFNISYNYTGSRRQSSFLKILQKNNIKKLKENNIKKLKEKGYYISHKGNYNFVKYVIDNRISDFEKGIFLIFQPNCMNFHIFIKKYEAKKRKLIKNTKQDLITQLI